MGKKNQRGVSLIALIITIAIILIIATAVLFRGGIDRIPWAQGGAHKMDKSVIAEAVEVYNTDKLTDADTPIAWAYPDLKQVDFTTGTASVTGGTKGVTIASATLPLSIGGTTANSSMCQIQFNGDTTWYNISSRDSATALTLVENKTGDSAGVSYTIRRMEEVNPVANATAANATTVNLDAADVRIQIGWQIAPVTPGSAWSTITAIDGNNDQLTVSPAVTVSSTSYRLRRPHASDVNYALIYFPKRFIDNISGLKTQIDKDFVSLQPTYTGKDMWTVVDIQALVDGSYVSRSSDKGMGVLNTDGSPLADFTTATDGITMSSDTEKKIYIRHAVNSDGGSGTSNIYYVKGVPAENNTVIY